MTSRKPSHYFLLWFAWACLIIYGSLLPFAVRPHTLAEAFYIFRHIPYLDLGVVSRADWIANILLYIPLAYLGTMWLSRLHSLPRKAAIAITILLGLGLAFAVEFIQIFFAPRTVSINDLLAETIGTLAGVLLWLVGHVRLSELAAALFLPGPTALTAGLMLYALAYLTLSLFPYDFVLSTAELQWKLLQGNYGWGFNTCGSFVQCGSQWLVEIASALPLGLLLARLLDHRHKRPASGLLIAAGIAVAIEAAQFLVASGVSTFTAVIAKTFGIGLGIRARELPSPQLAQRYARGLRTILLLSIFPYLGMVAMLNSWGNASWGNTEIFYNNLYAQHYLPFYYHYFTSETEAVTSLLAQAAIYLPLGIGFWLWHASGAAPLRRPPLFGLLLSTTVTVLIIEAGKLFIANSHPDPTNLLIALVSVWLGQRTCHWLAECIRTSAMQHLDNSTGNIRIMSMPRILLGAGLTVLVLGVVGLTLIEESTDSEAVFVAQIKREIPAPESLAPPVLTNFRLTHPRLPAPTQSDVMRLQTANPGFIAAKRRYARGGKGNIDAAILMARLEPGSQNMDTLFEQLAGTRFNWHGHAQVKLLAQGYDWLYADWTESQRRQLKDKLANGCNHVIEAIRGNRLSPYNATLYSGPAQALMACSIALYQDDPRGEPLMAFTDDLWKNRILPVWRQVMGQNGGWHEGADKISHGIGQAIYQLPAIWRNATGEDFFKSEPGIHGFLDFLVYRIRPDGRQIHLGDSSAFNRDAPDRLALALEYRHAAAYSLKPPPKKPLPTSWPWGPLTDNSLYDPDAINRLPLSKLFDGIGLVVMRSGWDSDASYITFKAGDNFSSFTHLDQGSFTIYKDGPLAIDSGVYDRYGSDHHINYTYQTIAHNVATVINPDEGAAVANNEFNRAPRTIANDGGQRRIGGDIEIYPHPLDSNEWKAKYDIYHTADIIQLTDEDGIVTVTADITAAYTNRFSGQGTLSSRSRRIERYLRTLIYDRTDNLLLLYDNISKTDPSFTSRWLIHSMEQPQLFLPDRFLISHAQDKTHPGGMLDATVLLPERPQLRAIGGPGMEFWVDGRNYDNGGGIYQILARRGKQAEAGNWRVEITPATISQTDQFLVALDLHQNQTGITPSIECSQHSGLTRCGIQGIRNRELLITADGIATIQ